MYQSIHRIGQESVNEWGFRKEKAPHEAAPVVRSAVLDFGGSAYRLVAVRAVVSPRRRRIGPAVVRLVVTVVAIAVAVGVGRRDARDGAEHTQHRAERGTVAVAAAIAITAATRTHVGRGMGRDGLMLRHGSRRRR